MSGEVEKGGKGSDLQVRRTEIALRLAAVCIIIAASLAGLALGARILVPIAEALLIWFVVNALADSLRRSLVFGPMLSESAARWVAVGLFVLIGVVAVYSIASSVVSMGPQAMQLQSSLKPLIRGVSSVLGPETGLVIDRAFDAIGLETLVRQIVLGLFGLINQFGLIGIYVAFLLVDQKFFPSKLRLLIPDPDRHAATLSLLGDLRRQIGAYLWLMTKASLATATLSLAVMALVGLENPVFWAMLVFLLNFIPTIGSVLGTLLPSVFALVQFQDLGTAALLALVLGAVQFTIGNILLPRMAGRTLNLSLTATVLCLFVWGALWGVTGMFLAVPLTASLLLIASRFDASRSFAIAFSRTGHLWPAAGQVDAPAEGDPHDTIKDDRR